MAQYKTGSASVVNGSAVVNGNGTSWSSQVVAGNLFAIQGEGVWYKIVSIQSDVRLTLESTYSSASKSAVAYAVHRDFTTSRGFAIPTYGDTDTASLTAASLQEIDATLAALAPINQIMNAVLTLNGTLNVRLVLNTPATSTATGTQGDFCFDANYIYICISDGHWKRSALTTW